jgi:hypothetical protein
MYDGFALNVTAIDGWRFSAVFKPWIGNGVFLISLSREITFSAAGSGGRFPQYGTGNWNHLPFFK